MSILRSRAPLATALTAAERVRSILATTSDLRVGVLNLAVDVPRHAVTGDGDLLFAPGPGSPEEVFSVAPNLPAQTVQVTATDLAPIAHPDRLRGRVQMTGKLSVHRAPLPAGALDRLLPPGADPRRETVLRFVPTRISLTWTCEGSTDPSGIDVDDYRRAFPDPLAELEADWLHHMHRDHPQALLALARHAAPGLVPDAVRPMALDRHGVALRLTTGGQAHDVRANFTTPVRCGCEVREAFGELLRHAVPDADDVC